MVHPCTYVYVMTMEESTSNITSCNYLTVGAAKNVVAALSTCSGFGALTCLVTVVLIALSHAYRQCLHRLTLILALANLFFDLSVSFAALPADIGKPDDEFVSVREGWEGACVLFGLVAQYFDVAKTLAVVWVSFYVFMMAVYRRQLQGPKWEATGVAFVFLVPAFLSWEPLIGARYGQAGAWCWIKDNCGNSATDHLSVGLRLGVSSLPNLLLYLLSLFFIASVAVMFSRGACCTRGRKKRQESKALKSILLLLVYPLLACLVAATNTIISVYLDAAKVDGRAVKSNLSGLVLLSLLQTLTVVLPIPYVLQPGMRRRLCRASRDVNSQLKVPAMQESTDHGGFDGDGNRSPFESIRNDKSLSTIVRPAKNEEDYLIEND